MPKFSGLSLTEMIRLHESLYAVSSLIGAETCRPCHQNTPSGDVLHSFCAQVDGWVDEIEAEIDARPLRSYEDVAAALPIRMRFLEGEAHYREALSLLSIGQTQHNGTTSSTTSQGDQ